MGIFTNDDEKDDKIVKTHSEGVSNSLGIDLGTLNTVVAKPSGDTFDLYQIPSVVSVKKNDPSAVLAVGEEAKAMLGRTPEDIVAIRPLKKGVIESIVQAQALLEKAMEIGRKDGGRIDRVVIGVPGDASEVEKKAAEEIGEKSGAEAIAINEGLASAIGAGLPIAEPTGIMIIDIGAGSTDLVIISLGGITDIQTVRWGGDDIDQNIVNLVKEKFNVEIGIHEAEKAKVNVGLIKNSKDSENLTIETIGKSSETNRPEKITIDSNLISEAVEPVIKEIIIALNLVLEKLSPELISGVYHNTLAVGGGSQLRGLKERICDELSIPVKISEDPMTVVAKGAAIVAAEPRALEPEVRLAGFK
jgi:rod shape-determining protein MreB